MKYDLYARAVRLVFKKGFRRGLVAAHGAVWASDVMDKSARLYREIVLRSPGIGGRQNPLTINVLTAAFVAAIFRASMGKLSPRELGAVFSEAGDRSAIFRLFARLSSRKNFTREWQDKRNRLALESQGRGFAADFVSEFVYGKTPNEYGIVYRECGICKLLEREQCAEIAPQMCKFDYVTAKHAGWVLTRSKTIADGDGVCDFWFAKKGGGTATGRGFP